MASQPQERRASRSPYAQTQTTNTIIVEPTLENQAAYIEIRESHKNLRLQTHVASQRNLIPPPTAPSTSTAQSPIEEPVTPSTQDPSTQDSNIGRRPRGKRKGPLQADKRWITAVKRRLKLACPTHRAKKITCGCHDFSKLEEGYQKFLQQQPTSRRRSHDNNDRSPHTPSEETFNREMLGVGGAAMDQEPPSNDIDILQSATDDDEHVVRSNVQQIVSGFDSDTVRLDTTMLQAPGHTYHPGNDMSPRSPNFTPEDYLEIGSRMLGYPNRWHCRYRGDDADSHSLWETPSQECSWTGKLENLRSHFWTDHHPFQAATPCFWHVCTRCNAKVQPQDDLGPPVSPLQCTTDGCSAPNFEIWYFGSTRTESVADSLPGLTQSSVSEAAFSYLSPDGDQSGMGGRRSSGAFNSHFGADSTYDHISYYNAKWDTISNSSDQHPGCGCYPQGALRPLARRDDIERHSPSSRPKLYQNVKSIRCSPRRCPIRLLSYVKLSIGHLLSIMLSLFVTTIIRESGYLFECHESSSHTFGSDAISWWSLMLLCLGFVATWSFKDQRARARSVDKPEHYTRSRQLSRNESPLIPFRYSVVWTA